MSTEITTAFKKQYAAAFMMAYQQSVSELAGTVRNETQQGEEKFWDTVGATTVQWDLARGAATPRINTPHTRRRCTLRTATWADTISDPDRIQAMADPTSDYLRAGVAAMQRAKDERILEAIWATAYTGKAGATAVTAETECNKINGSGTLAAPGTALTDTTEAGLSLVHIAVAGKAMDDNSVPAEGRHIVANVDQKWYLLGSTKATSSDYNSVQALVKGDINSYMGFTFHWLPSDRFTASTTDTGCYQCAAYQRDAVLLATAMDIKTKIDQLPDYNYDTQVWAQMMIGAVRLQPLGVIPMLLKKQPTMAFNQA